MRLFCDLDSVLTDFSQQLEDLLGYKPPKESNDPDIWKKIDKAGEKFWSEMSWLSDGHTLWNAIKKYDPTILTAPSNHPSSEAGKKIWFKRELPNVKYILEQDKEKYASPDAILIDDRKKNIDKWKKAGGIAILHKNAEDTIKELEKIMNKNKKASNDIKFKEVYNPDKGSIEIPKLRGSHKPGGPMKSIKGGPYKREKYRYKGDIEASAHRIVLNYIKKK